jgi:predicted MFS family arabinose efflux permease
LFWVALGCVKNRNIEQFSSLYRIDYYNHTLDGEDIIMLATLRQRDFSLLWFAGLISLTGTWMLNIALPIVIYDMTGSALAVGGILFARTIPGLFLSMIAGVFVDRWERRQTLVIVNLLLAISILPLFMVGSGELLWLVYVVSFFQSVLAQFFVPAESAMLPLLSDPKLLVSANALNALNNNFARLIGSAAGGVMVTVVGFGSVVIIDIVSFLLAALLCALISVKSHPNKTNDDSQSLSLSLLINQWKMGIRLIWDTSTVRLLFILSALPAIGEAVMYVLFVPFVLEVLRGSEVDVGGLMSVQAIGGLIGGVIISWVAVRVKTYQLLGVSGIIFGLLDFALFNYSTFFSGMALAYIVLVTVGPFAVGMGAGFNTLIQTNVEDAYRGRVFGVFGLTGSIFSLVGIAFAGYAGDTVGIVPVINVQAYSYIIVGIVCLIALREKPEETALASNPI